MMSAFLNISNGEAIDRKKIPHLPFADFSLNALEIVKKGGKVVQFFAYQDGPALKFMAVLRTDRIWVAGCLILL